jgi:hypothetical protein
MSMADDVVDLIDRDQLVKFALEICNIDSAVPFEAEVAEYIYQWLKREDSLPEGSACSATGSMCWERLRGSAAATA